jgi:hypothetical protein
MALAADLDRWEGADVSLGEVERRLGGLRGTAEDEGLLRTSVLTHIAWVPLEWEQQALDTLAGMAERHPSRTIVLLPQPAAAEDGIDASLALRTYPLPEASRSICTEVIELRLRGNRCVAPASIVSPLLVADLPVFLRWRGLPPYGDRPFEELVEVADRLIVDSTEWAGLPEPYRGLVAVFDRVAASDIAWARTSRWRRQLASLWPAIAEVRRIRVRGTEAQAHLLAGWLRSRLRRPVELEHEQSDRLIGVDIDGEPAPFPPGDPPQPSDVLSDELERFTRDPVYEAAVAATV